MNISSISSASSNAFSIGNNDGVNQLEKQKASLERELQKVNLSKVDEKTKQLKVQQLRLQIQQIDTQIQQIEAKKTNQSQNISKTNANDGAKNSTNNKVNIQI